MDGRREAAIDVAVARCVAVAAAVALVAQRAYLIIASPRPGIFGDEAGLWAVARYVARRAPYISMFDNPPYSVPGGIALAPIVRLVDSAVNQYRLFLVLSTVCGLAAALVVARLLRTHFAEGVVGQALGFAACAIFPAIVLSASFSWVEYLAPLWFVAAVAAVPAALSSERPVWWIAAGLLAGSAPIVHGRFAPLPVLMTAVAISVIAIRRAVTGPALGLVAVAAAYFVSRWGSEAIYSRVWDDPRTEERVSWLGRLDELAYYRAVVVYAIGHAWYALASSFGLAALGVARVVAAVRAGGERAAGSVWVLVACGGVLASSVLVNAANGSTPDLLVAQPDVLFYGRYGDPAVMLLAAIGVAWLAREHDRWRVAAIAAAALVVSGVATRAWASGAPSPQVFGVRVPGVWLFPFDERHVVSVAAVTLVGVAAMLALVVTGGRALRFAATAMCLLVAASVLGTRSVVDVHDTYDFRPLYEPVRDSGATPGDVVVAADVAFDEALTLAVLAQEYFLVGDGWRFRASDALSDELIVNGLPEGANLVLLLSDADSSSLADFAVVSDWFGIDILVRVGGGGDNDEVMEAAA